MHNDNDNIDTRRLITSIKTLLVSSVALGALASAPVQATEPPVASANPASGSASAEEQAIPTDTGTGEIVVTAQRRAENIMKVPISITSFTPDQIDKQGIRQIEDLSRLAPSLVFTRTAGVSGNNGTNIAIRGIASDVGSATTAIYVDDTPIQIRSIGYFSGNPYPRVFDLERVEVLRGPQGTLFGASAEGGAVRFITPQPSFTKFDIYGRAELSTTENGAPSYEAGIAVGGPVSETLAVRASAWYRRDGGYVDRINPATGATVAKDINSQNTYADKIALTWKPIDELTITPSLYYQKIESKGRNQFWEGYGDQNKQNYKTGIANAEPANDTFFMPALKAQYDFGKISLISNTSYFDRSQDQVLDYSTFLSTLRTGNPFGAYGNKDVTNGTATQTMGQKNFTQEVRLQSFEPDQLIDWTVGVYYSKAKQRFQNLSGSGRIPGVISSGYPQYLGRYNLFDNIQSSDEQIAGFASVDIKPMNGLKITLGGRVTQNKFAFTEVRDGPTNSGTRTTFTAGQKQTAFTPKVGVSYELDGNNLLYASASKGFRPGGAQAPVDPTFCAKDLGTLGLTGSPREFKSDSLWSFEGGTKNKLFGGKLLLDVNAYYVKWKNIQQSIRLPTCSFSFIGNLGSATAKGTDISISATPVRGLTIGANIGYNDTTFDSDVFGGNGLLLKQAGDRIGGPQWTGSVFAQGKFPISASAKGYGRVDYTFSSKGIVANPKDFGYDVGLPGLGATDYLTLRAGVELGGIDVSAFVNNVTNSNDPLSRSHDAIGGPLYYVETYRPRTFGMTALFHY